MYRWVDDGEIPCRRVRDQLRFNRTDLLEWATARRMPVHVEAFEEDEPDDRPPSLAAALRSGGLHAQLGAGTDREAVVRAIVERLPLPADIDRELVIEVLFAREAIGTCPIGDGIAIPLVRNPIVAGGAPPSTTVLYFNDALPLVGPDGRPVRTLFVAIAPTVRVHLQLVARLARALVDPRFKAVVEAREQLAALIEVAQTIEAEPRVTPSEGAE